VSAGRPARRPWGRFILNFRHFKRRARVWGRVGRGEEKKRKVSRRLLL